MRWRPVALSEIADVRLGRQRSPKNHSGPTNRKYLRAANVGWGGLKLDDVKVMNFTDAEMAVYRLEPGDLLLSEASGSPAEVGKPAIWMGELDECAFQNTLIRVRPIDDVDSRYLLHFFSQQAATGAFARGSRGVGIHHLGRDALSHWPIPLPPLDEQRRIAAILDHADALRAKSRQVGSKHSQLKQLIFDTSFGDGLGIAAATLDEVAEVASGITKGRKTGEATRLVPYLAVANVQDGHLALNHVKEIDATDSEVKRYALAYGDLVLTEGGDPDKLGRGTVWRAELPLCLHQNHIFRVRVAQDRLEPEYLSAYLASRPAKDYFLSCAKQTTGIASINTTQLRRTPVCVPPLDNQRAYIRRVHSVVGAQRYSEAQASALDNLFASLQSRAFSGRL